MGAGIRVVGLGQGLGARGEGVGIAYFLPWNLHHLQRLKETRPPRLETRERAEKPNLASEIRPADK